MKKVIFENDESPVISIDKVNDRHIVGIKSPRERAIIIKIDQDSFGVLTKDRVNLNQSWVENNITELLNRAKRSGFNEAFCFNKPEDAYKWMLSNDKD